MPALRRQQGPVRGGYGVGSGRNAPQGELLRSRIADMGRIRRQAASPTCRRPSSTGWRVPFRHQKKGYPTGYPFFYAFVRIGEIPGVCDTGINARTGPGCHVLRSQISRIPASPDPAAAEKRAVCNIPPCDSGRNPDQAFPSGFVPGRPAPAFTAGSAPLPRLL